MLKTRHLPRTVGLVCVCVWGGGGGLRRHNHSNIYHDPAIGYSISGRLVLAGWAVVTNAFHLVHACA